jgi:predicted MPP superfamily phosphohydrolase
MKFNRRKFLRYSFASGCLGLGVYVWQVEPTWIAYEQRELSIPGLPSHLVGKKLVQLSDLHIGPHVSDSYLKNQFERVKSLNAEFVVYTGDFVDQANSFHFQKLKNLANEFPQGSLGTAGVLGNHDYELYVENTSFGRSVGDLLSESGVPILIDETIEFDGLTIAGLEDFSSPGFSQQRSKDVIQSLPKSTLVLSHNPDTADLPIWNQYNSWILVGHTHGGQCRVPGFTPPFLPVRNRNYVAGAYAIQGGHQMYINRGIGHTLKVRFCARPEITVFTLKSANQA